MVLAYGRIERKCETHGLRGRRRWWWRWWRRWRRWRCREGRLRHPHGLPRDTQLRVTWLIVGGVVLDAVRDPPWAGPAGRVNQIQEVARARRRPGSSHNPSLLQKIWCRSLARPRRKSDLHRRNTMEEGVAAAAEVAHRRRPRFHFRHCPTGRHSTNPGNCRSRRERRRRQNRAEEVAVADPPSTGNPTPAPSPECPRPSSNRMITQSHPFATTCDEVAAARHTAKTRNASPLIVRERMDTRLLTRRVAVNLDIWFHLFANEPVDSNPPFLRQEGAEYACWRRQTPLLRRCLSAA